MCRSSAISLCLWLAGCTLPLDSGGTDVDAASAPDSISGCALFAAAAFQPGTGQSVTLPSGATLWTFDAALTTGGRMDGVAALAQIVPGSCAGTLADTTVALPPSGTDTDFAKPLDLVRVGSDVWQFYETWRLAAGAPFGVKTTGRGVAKWDSATGQFTRASSLLWTADRPAYGQSALVDGAWVYAYGCLAAADGWTRDCYVARAPSSQLADVNAWQYATAVGEFTANPDGALPILIGVGDVSVRRHASGRLLASYLEPLDTVLQVRALLGPTGPFSAPHPVGQCAAPPDTFCVGAVQHPELDPDAATLAVTFARASFDPLTDDVRWPRLAYLPLPDALP